MKTIFSLTINLMFSLSSFLMQSQTLEDMYHNFEKKGNVTAIKITKPMFGMLNKLDIDNQYIAAIKPLLNDVDNLRMFVFSKATFPDSLISENEENIKRNKSQAQWIKNSISGLDFKELMTVKQQDNEIQFVGGGLKDETLEDLIINVDSKEDNILFVLNGQMKMDDVNSLIERSQVSNIQNSKNNTYSSKAGEEYRNVGNFSGISSAVGIKVYYTQGSPQSVKVEADADKLENIITEVNNGILKITIDNKGKTNLNFKNLVVNVTAPELNSVKVASGSKFYSKNGISSKKFTVDTNSGGSVDADIKADVVDIDCSSGSSANLNIDSEKVDVKVNSGASANLEGKADSALFKMSSAGSCDAEKFETKMAVIDASSASSATINVTKDLNAKVSSVATIKYKGKPQKVVSDIDKVSGGKLKELD